MSLGQEVGPDYFRGQHLALHKSEGDEDGAADDFQYVEVSYSHPTPHISTISILRDVSQSGSLTS